MSVKEQNKPLSPEAKRELEKRLKEMPRMSLHDYFAAAALNGMLSHVGFDEYPADDEVIANLCDTAYKFAYRMRGAATAFHIAERHRLREKYGEQAKLRDEPIEE